MTETAISELPVKISIPPSDAATYFPICYGYPGDRWPLTMWP